MTIYQKFGLSFILALSLHLLIFGAFGLNISEQDQQVKQKPLPEIIQASILDDTKIQQEANRLKAAAEDKRIAQNRQQKQLENNRKKEQKLLAEAKRKRLKEQKTTKILAEKRKQQAIDEQRKLTKIKQQKKLEAAKLAKIKQQKAVEAARIEKVKKKERLENKRLDDLKKAADKKRELARQAEVKKQQALLEQQQREAEAKAADQERKKQAAQAQIAKDKKSTIAISNAIQQRVINRWIKPPTSANGLRCKIRVKLLPSGDVMDVQVIKSSGDSVFDRSAENAVRKASPLPVPNSRALFNQNFRTFTFNFIPK